MKEKTPDTTSVNDLVSVVKKLLNPSGLEYRDSHKILDFYSDGPDEIHLYRMSFDFDYYPPHSLQMRVRLPLGDGFYRELYEFYLNGIVSEDRPDPYLDFGNVRFRTWHNLTDAMMYNNMNPLFIRLLTEAIVFINKKGSLPEFVRLVND